MLHIYISLDEFFKAIPTHVQKLMKRAADYSEKEQWEIAFTLSTIALEELENSVESDDWTVGFMLSIVGCINTKANKYNDAESLWKRAFPILEKYHERSRSIFEILWDVFIVFFKNERHESVIFIGEKIIAICEKYQKEFHLLEAHRVGMCKAIRHLKQLDEAKKFLHAGLPVYADKFGIENIEVDKVFELLEIVYFWRYNIVKSKEFFQNYSELTDAILLSSLGMLCENGNFLCKAFNYFQRVIKFYENKDLPNHSTLAICNMEVGILYLLIAIDDVTELSLNKTHIINMTKLADNHLLMLQHKTALASSYVQLGLFFEARRIYEEILENFYTDESGVSILEWARSNERNREDNVPILNEDRDLIVPVLWNLSAMYILDRNYKFARILQNFAESQPDLTEDNWSLKFC